MQYKESTYDMYDFAYPETYGTSFYNTVKSFDKKMKLLKDVLKLVGTDEVNSEKAISYFKSQMKKNNLLQSSSIDDFINNLILKVLLK